MTGPGDLHPDEGASAIDALLLRHGPSTARDQLGIAALEELRLRGAATVDASVIVGDLRMSTFVLKESVQPALFARFIVGFTEAVRSLVRSREGWFDKFTGDGFIAFWLHRPDADPGVTLVPEFCQTVLPAADALIANLRRTSRNFPSGVGLALGVDRGPCQLVRVGDALTVVGGPVVGATRMVGGARARQTLVNVLPGEELERAGPRLVEGGIRVERTNIRTKEYPRGQEAYELIFPAAHRVPASPMG